MACVNFYKALNYEVECIFCDYGQPASISEKQASQIIAAYYSVPYETIEVKNINIPKLGEICGRNALLIWAAFCKIGFGSYKIVLGIHAGTEYPDCSPQFIDATNRLFDVYTNGTVIAEAPFINWKKADIVAYCRANSLPYHYTYSCEVGSVPPCGRCLPEPASYVFFYALFNLRKLLYLITPLSLSCFGLPYPQNTLLPKSACSRTYTSGWHVGQISSGCSFLSGSP